MRLHSHVAGSMDGERAELHQVAHRTTEILVFSWVTGGSFVLNEATLFGLVEEAMHLKDQSQFESAACPTCLKRGSC